MRETDAREREAEVLEILCGGRSARLEIAATHAIDATRRAGLRHARVPLDMDFLEDGMFVA